jgi:hypothetical protein
LECGRRKINMTKTNVIDSIKELPEEFDLDLLLEKLLFIEKVEKGLEQVKDGKVVSHNDVKKMVDKWRK